MDHAATHVRWATIEDAEDLVRLNREFNGGYRAVEQVQASIESNRELVALACLDDTVVGFACAQWFSSFCYDHPYGEITEMYVQEHARRKGLAAGMISLLEEGLRERGVRSVKLLTGLTNERAIQVYQNSGYQKERELLLSKRF
ncbi:GNAT family N-acetyltransferase [Paenibacillus sp. GYB004]|uniref:GNAT family N-acetyltransferase n=1 Tax=Paenibacillus sp. GYB004 TaxID=2994393 RepID=UPI002F96B5CD